mmetsp:Transcript_52015/g.119673  ORF Transcript_52015/g.119673 Transcript_52015/m.119673 type:complete len:161 (-) Transcript_52015:923-1405(-)
MAESDTLSQFSGRLGESLRQKYVMEESEYLGRGKFSVVHRTRRRGDGQAVALKTIQVFEMGSNERNECMNEIRLLQQMHHPHIITYLDCVMEDNELTVVMELAGFGDLAGLIQRAREDGMPLEEAAIWQYICQISACGLFLHTHSQRRDSHRSTLSQSLT